MTAASVTLKVHDLEGKEVGSLQLPETFTRMVNSAVVWQAVRMYQANQRQGTARTKSRAEVSGGGRKPWRQKHTGRARHGSTRSPIWTHGGVAWGPRPRNYRYALPKQLLRRALLESLRDKVRSEAVTVVESLEGLEPKTKALAGLLSRLRMDPPVLLVVPQAPEVLLRISRNLPRVVVRSVSDLACLDVLRSARLLVTSEAIRKLGVA